MPRPSVSVVVPCYNAARTLGETIDSIRRQTFSDLEIIAVDDGSTDGTAAQLRALADVEPRLRIISQANQGMSAARNAAIRAARGAFIALLDSDDLWDRNFLQIHMAHLTDAGIGISYAKVRYIDMASEPTGQTTRPKLSGLTPGDLLRSNPCTSIIVVRREVFDDAGLFDERMRRVEDQEWVFRAAVNGWRIEGIDRVLASYRITPGSASSNVAGMLEAHVGFIEKAKSLAPEIVARHGRLAHAGQLRYCARRVVEHGGNAKVAQDYLIQSLRTAPDLLWREPVTTLSAAIRILSPAIGRLMAAGRARLRSQEI